MCEIESIHFLNDMDIIAITIMDNDFRFSLNFYKELSGEFINHYRPVTDQLSLFLIETGLVTAYQHPKYSIKPVLKLTTKTLLSVL